MLENVEEVKKAETDGRLCFGTIDSWLTYCLTGGKSYVTEATNASRTNLMNLETLAWDPELLKLFDIKQESLPQIIKESAAEFGIIEEPVLAGVPIAGILGDQQSSCLGHTLHIGEVKNTYGTGCFILMNGGPVPIHSSYGLLTTVLYKLSEDQPAYYALEGAVECGGVTLEWAKNNMGLFKDFQEFDELLNSVPNSGGVYFVPAFSGLFSPYWRNDVRGTILGLSLHSSKAHILKALSNGILMRCKEVIDAMGKDCSDTVNIEKIYVDGGVSLNQGLMQTQSDFLNKEVYILILILQVITKKEREITAIGAGIAAGLKLGVWKDLDEVRHIIQIDKVFKPQILISQEKTDEDRINNEKKWNDAITRALGWN